MPLAYIGLGSNLEQPEQQVKQALQELNQISGTRLLAASQLYGSTPVGPAGQPDYVNAAACVDTKLLPLQLLDALQAIEQQHHRVRDLRWGPRTLDLDVLLYDSDAIDCERLTVPHPRLHERNFVLYPLAEIDSELVLPSGTTLRSLLADCSRDGLWPLNDTSNR